MTAPEQERGEEQRARTDPAIDAPAEEDVPRIYLRTTWALNPGLPHAVDFPELLR